MISRGPNGGGLQVGTELPVGLYPVPFDLCPRSMLSHGCCVPPFRAARGVVRLAFSLGPCGGKVVSVCSRGGPSFLMTLIGSWGAGWVFGFSAALVVWALVLWSSIGVLAGCSCPGLGYLLSLCIP